MMLYRPFGATGAQISVIGLGGHEFHPDGRVRGFSDDYKLAVKRGHVFDGFGDQNREAIVKRALDLGINLFDLTIDSEKEAMGRVLARLKPAQEILIQTRPEGMVYSYDPANKQMAQYPALRDEVIRILRLLRREVIDIFNFAFMQTALDADPEYMDKIGDNIRRLKAEGLIRFASADTFSGQAVYLQQINSGYFDSTFINYNPAETAIETKVIPGAVKRGMGILTREILRKGQIFEMAEQAGIVDRGAIAHAAIKWAIQNVDINSVVLGISSVEQLEDNVTVLDQVALTDDDQSIITAICATELYQSEYSQRSAGFLGQR